MPPPVVHHFRSHWFATLPKPTASFAGQTVIVTGSNTGLGLEAARQIAGLQASRVILAVRSIPRGEAAAQSIRESTKNTSVIIEPWELDLESYSSVKAFAARASTLDRLDVVVENAGILTHKFSMAEDNERTITVNYISTMLLGLLLLPKLRETAVKHDKDAVLTVVGSFLHWLTGFPEGKADDILAATADESKANMNERYATSKLMELLSVRELANQITKSDKQGNVIVSCVTPGSVHSELNREATGVMAAVRGYAFRKLIARTPQEGSRTLVHAAAGGRETHGQYLDNCQVAEPKLMSDFVRSKNGEETQEKLWKQLLAKLEAIEPGISQNI